MAGSSDDSALAARMFEQHGSAIRRYLRRLSGHPDVANDLTQDVYVRVVRAAARYEPRERERAWLFRIARNVFLDHRKAGARSPQAIDARLEEVAPAAQGTRVDVNAALQRLDATDREAFLLCEVGGLRYDEIAALLGLTAAGVRSRIYRARLSLREMLMPPGPLASARHVRSSEDDDY